MGKWLEASRPNRRDKMTNLGKTIVPSAEQELFYDWVKHGSGNCVLEAVAGAGKTTTLTTGVSLMEGDVFIGAYNKKMGEELSQKTSHMPKCRAGTFHSAGFGALRFYLKNKNIRAHIDDKKVRKIAERIVHDTPYEEFVQAIARLVSLAKQMGFGVHGLTRNPTPKDWLTLIDRFDIMESTPEWALPETLIDLAVKTIIRNNEIEDVIDFDDMVYLPLYLNLRFFRNDWVLIDEAQDTNPTRREMAARMLKPTGRLVAVGDPHQAIFGFTGADSDSLSLIRDRFHAQTLSLSVTFRCPKAVVREAQKYVKHIHSHPNSPEGELMAMSGTEMFQFIKAGDAIVARNNRPLVETCLRLVRHGIPAKIEGRDIGQSLVALITRWKVRGIKKLQERLLKWREEETAKARREENEERFERITDQYETLQVLMDRAESLGVDTLGGLTEMIRNMFDDVGSDGSLVVLSSVHRSKGLEWDRVFILNRETTMPSPRATQDWQLEQEYNLVYVALTRAKHTLVDVTMPKEAKWSDG